MLTKDMQHKVENLKKKRDFTRLNELFRSMPAVDVAELIRPWPLPEQVQVIEELPIADSANVFSRLPYDEQYKIAKTMGHENFTSIFQRFPVKFLH